MDRVILYIPDWDRGGGYIIDGIYAALGGTTVHIFVQGRGLISFCSLVFVNLAGYMDFYCRASICFRALTLARFPQTYKLWYLSNKNIDKADKFPLLYWATMTIKYLSLF